MEITWKDLAKLNTVYWYYNELGEDYSDITDALRNIYYFCERELDETVGVVQPKKYDFDGTQFSESVLPEKPLNHRPKVSHREKMHERLKRIGG